VGVERSEGGGRLQWCGLNGLISAREGRRHDEALSEHETEAATSSSWLHEKEAWHGVATSAGGEATPKRGNGGDNTSWPDANLIGPKNKKKSTQLIQLPQMDGEDLK
jgi:hypothetical protein